MAKKSVIKPVITKVAKSKDVTKIPELAIITSSKKILSDADSELSFGRESDEKDLLIVKSSASPQKFTNSSLVSYTKLSPNCSRPRNHKIDTITIHCMAGNLTVESCGNLFASTDRQASSNYGIGSDGRIGLYVNECDRSWCSSNKDNDNRAVTIEVANDGGQVDNLDSALNWHVSDAAMASLINLVADICKRNEITSLKWQNNKSLIGQVDKQNMTVHRWFKAKACPGGYLMSKMSYVAESVNKKLGSSVAPVTTKETYRVRVSWEDSKSQVGAYSILENAIAKAKSVGSNYKVYDSKGKQVYPEISTSIPADELYRVRLSWDKQMTQIGAYKNLNNAIQCAKSANAKGGQYKVFDSSGKVVYPIIAAAANPSRKSKKAANNILESRPDYVRGNSYTATEDFNVHMFSGELSPKKLNKHFTNDLEAPDASQPAVFKAGKTLVAQRLSFFVDGQWWMETELGWVKIWDEATHKALFM